VTDFAQTMEIELMKSHRAPPAAEAGQKHSSATSATVAHASKALQCLRHGQTCGSPLMSNSDESAWCGKPAARRGAKRTITRSLWAGLALHFNNRRLQRLLRRAEHHNHLIPAVIRRVIPHDIEFGLHLQNLCG